MRANGPGDWAYGPEHRRSIRQESATRHGSPAPACPENRYQQASQRGAGEIAQDVVDRKGTFGKEMLGYFKSE